MGYRRYYREGQYDELASFLRQRVDEDHNNASQFALSEATDWTTIPSIIRSGDVWELLEQHGLSAGYNEAYCVTYIVNGRPRIETFVDEFEPGAFPDYLRIYFTGGGFDFAKLIQQ